MKEIVRQYSKTLITMISMIAVFAILFAGVISNGIETGRIDGIKEGIPMNTKLEISNVKIGQTLNRLPPTVEFKEQCEIHRNKKYSLEDCIVIKDCDKNDITGTLMEVVNQNGERLVCSDNSFEFAQRGVYKFKIWAIDNQGAGGICWININVN